MKRPAASGSSNATVTLTFSSPGSPCPDDDVLAAVPMVVTFAGALPPPFHVADLGGADIDGDHLLGGGDPQQGPLSRVARLHLRALHPHGAGEHRHVTGLDHTGGRGTEGGLPAFDRLDQ